jgi:formylglycine-generating enzyme required for sulfatase activity
MPGDADKPAAQTPAGADDLITPDRYQPPAGGRGDVSPKLRLGAVVTGLALLLSAAIAWFLLTGKAVTIDTQPAGAAMDISGGLSLRLADYILLRPGDYRLHITAPGYHPLDQTLSVSDKQNQRYSFALNRLPGHLKVSSTPAATVVVDGQARGRTPVTVDGLEHGRHKVRLEEDRYLPRDQEVEIEGLDHTQALSVKLEPAWADVTLRSTPAGATIFVDDAEAGTTPTTVQVLQGERRLRVKLHGYKAWQQTLEIHAGTALELPEITLQPADALVQVITRPAGAGVTVDNDYRGQTPLETALAPQHDAVIRLFKPGYRRATRRLKLAAGEDKTLRVELQPEMASVHITARPEDAELLVDGRSRGKADQVLQLNTRPHHIEIRKDGYVTYKIDLTPRAGIDQQLRVALKTLREAKLEAAKPLIKTAGGQTMKLFRPSRFTMGASRREPGRRANETLHKVNLTRLFYLSLREVSNTEYRRFDPAHDSGQEQQHGLNGASQPVVNITWQQAAQYCNWLSKQDHLKPFYLEQDGKITGFNPSADGYRLPTEAEWAWAARVRPDGSLLKFPWGDKLPPPPKSGNYADESAANIIGLIIRGYNDGYIVSAPVGSFPPDGKGLYDMGGNVAEWVNDYYDIMISAADRVETDPLGPDSGEHHVIRGSSWANGGVTELRFSFRDYGSEARNDVGFRIARFVE